MSTKVYTAYRVKPRVAKNPRLLWEWIRDTTLKGEAGVKQILRDMYTDFMGGVDPESPEYKAKLATYDGDEYATRLTLAHNFLYKEYLGQLHKMERTPFNFDVVISIRELHGHLYIIPYCDWMMRDVLKFLDTDSRLEDFAYWNNVDRKPEVSERAWRKRGRVWEELDPIADPARWRQYLSLEIMSAQKFSFLDPWIEMSHENRDRKRARKSEAPASV